MHTYGRRDHAAYVAVIERRTRELAASPETALAYLVKCGFVHPDGTLTEEYGGPKNPSKKNRKQKHD